MIRRHFLAGIVGFKALCAAAALTVGVGQAAQAATVKNYDLYLRYEGASFVDYVFYDTWNNSQEYSGDFYPASDPQNLGVPHAKFRDLAVGDIVRFIAAIVFPEDERKLLSLYDNGGRAPKCSIGKTSCAATSEAYQKGSYNAFEIREDDQIFITGSEQVGSAFTYSEWTSFSPNDGERWATYAWYSDAHFTVVDIVDTPAPVPLPATAALLPLGIGALAMMRRRRKA